MLCFQEVEVSCVPLEIRQNFTALSLCCVLDFQLTDLDVFSGTTSSPAGLLDIWLFFWWSDICCIKHSVTLPDPENVKLHKSCDWDRQARCQAVIGGALNLFLVWILLVRHTFWVFFNNLIVVDCTIIKTQLQLQTYFALLSGLINDIDFTFSGRWFPHHC